MSLCLCPPMSISVYLSMWIYAQSFNVNTVNKVNWSRGFDTSQDLSHLSVSLCLLLSLSFFLYIFLLVSLSLYLALSESSLFHTFFVCVSLCLSISLYCFSLKEGSIRTRFLSLSLSPSLGSVFMASRSHFLQIRQFLVCQGVRH